MATSHQKYQQAAITYFIYGIIYLIGAIYIAQAGLTEKTAGPYGGFFYFALGGLFVIVIPVLIWKGFKWFTRILALFMIYRIYGLITVILKDDGKLVPLPGGMEISFQTGGIIFVIAAAVTCLMLIRAGWDL